MEVNVRYQELFQNGQIVFLAKVIAFLNRKNTYNYIARANFMFNIANRVSPKINFFYFEGFTSIPTALTANDRNRRIQVYQASDG